MIVKIWPIKGVQGMKRASEYVQDPEKTISCAEQEKGGILWEDECDVHRAIKYIANEQKTESRYVSGYMCDPFTAVDSFRRTQATIFLNNVSKRPRNMEKEVLAFHMVQSFPEELDISDEEVHQCGIELLRKLEKHQGVVCSHVHPVLDMEREVHGRCKHNHILFNAFIQAAMIDPEHPGRVKYNDCKATYEQLRIWNDEIAIEHGLPIIRNPDLERVYSWTEMCAINQGKSWKERIRLDIEFARRSTKNWSEFKSFMERCGYQIREGAHTTYTAPDGEHKIRGKTLGTACTKESLELFWIIRNRVDADIEKALIDNNVPRLWLMTKRHGPLNVGIPLGTKNDATSPAYLLPMEKADRSHEVLASYFNGDELYDVQDASGKVVGTATGNELAKYLDDLRRGEDKHWLEEERLREVCTLEGRKNQETIQAEEERRRRAAKKEKGKYTCGFQNSRTKREYCVDFWDENGRERSLIELVLLMAIVVLKNEGHLWEHKGPLMEIQQNEAYFGPVDWKVQNMLDAIHVADEEGITSVPELEERIDQVGAEYSRARSAYTRTKRAKEKMEALDKSLTVYERTKDIATRILVLPDSPEKQKMQEQYKQEIDDYKKARAVMYAYKVNTQEEIDDFRVRYSQIEKNLPGFEERLDESKERYRRLKKLQYNTRLAQIEQYCYGPEYDPGVEFSWEEFDVRVSTLNQKIGHAESRKEQHEREHRSAAERENR